LAQFLVEFIRNFHPFFFERRGPLEKRSGTSVQTGRKNLFFCFKNFWQICLTLVKQHLVFAAPYCEHSSSMMNRQTHGFNPFVEQPLAQSTFALFAIVAE